MAIVAVHMTSDSVAFMSRLLDLGAIMGAPGSISINPKIQPLVDALYHVLAGGTVTGTVPGTLTVTAGVPSVVTDLQAMERDCTANINAVNGTVRFRLVMEF
jgi:hypothetical protein